MSRRNRTILPVLGFVAALSLIIPASSQAMGLWESQIPTAQALEKAWSWLTSQLPGAVPEKQGDWRKEGSMINPNGGNSLFSLPMPPLDSADEGSMINPNGHH